MKARRRHRITLAAAGAYNIAWGTYAVIDPQWFFRLSGLPPSNTPQIFACLGMVLGLYGVLYLEAARIPESGWPTAAIGLTGKVLGPAGLAWLIATHTWRAATIILVATNDLLWWIPFASFFRDACPSFRATWHTTSAASPAHAHPQPHICRLNHRHPNTDQPLHDSQQ